MTFNLCRLFIVEFLWVYFLIFPHLIVDKLSLEVSVWFLQWTGDKLVIVSGSV